MSSNITTTEIAEMLGLTKRAIAKRAGREKWIVYNGNGRGGQRYAYCISDLPVDIQIEIAKKKDLQPEDIRYLVPEAAIVAYNNKGIASSVPQGSMPTKFTISTSSPTGRSPGRTPGDRPPTLSWGEEAAVSPVLARNERVSRIARICTEARELPAGTARQAHLKAVALKYNTTHQTIYRWLKRYEDAGLNGLAHKKSNKGTARSWSPDAIAFWSGLI